MPFETDRQTLQDLSLTGINGHQAILELFKPITLGGMVMLKELFDHPLNDMIAIQNRLDAIRFLDTAKFPLRLDKEEADFIEYYLKTPDRAEHFSKARALKGQFKNWVKPSNKYYVTLRGVRLLVYILHHLQDVLMIHTGVLPALLEDLLSQAEALIGCIRPELIQKSGDGKPFSTFEREELDLLFRYTKKQEVRPITFGCIPIRCFYSGSKNGTTVQF